MSLETVPLSELDHLAWSELQQVVRSFRDALRRGEYPEIEAFASASSSNRPTVLVELIHEDMEFRIKAGEAVQLGAYLKRFPELAEDPRALSELVAAESALRRRARAEVNDCASLSASGGRFGRYELQEVIGQGAFGVVFRARDTLLGRTVALKRLRAGLLQTPSAAERFMREARSAAVLQHPHLVPVFDAGQVGDEPFLVTALVEGRNLADLLAEHRPNFRQSAQWVAGLADALEHAHQHGVIHRDVKPSNVLIDQNGQAHLADFGLARDPSAEATLTLEGQMIGTPAYMAPEQTRGEKGTIDARTDVYSLGVILYELLTRTRPFLGTARMLLLRIQEEEPRPPRKLDESIPLDLQTICLKAIAKEPGRRYVSAAAFAADLNRFLAGEPVAARAEGRLALFWRKCRRRPVLFGLAAALVLAWLLGFAGVSWQWRRAETFRRRAEAGLEVAQYQQQHAQQALELAEHTLETFVPHIPQSPVESHSSRTGRKASYDPLGDEYRDLLHEFRGDPSVKRRIASMSLFLAYRMEVSAPLADALRASQDAEVHCAEIARDDPSDWQVRTWLARCLALQGRLLIVMHRDTEARGKLQQALSLVEPFVLPTSRIALQAASVESAQTAYFAIEKRIVELARKSGQHAEANAAEARMREIAEGMVRDLANKPGRRDHFVWWASELGNLLRDVRPEEARSWLRQACEFQARTAPTDPLDPVTARVAARAYHVLAGMDDHADRAVEAARGYEKAIALFEQLSARDPRDAALLGYLGNGYHVLGRLHADGGRPQQALAFFQRSISFSEQLCLLRPEYSMHFSDCAGTWYRMGEALLRLDRRLEAVGACCKSLACLRGMSPLDMGEAEYRRHWKEQSNRAFWLLLAALPWPG